MNTARFFGGLCLFASLAKCDNEEDPNWNLYFEDTFSGNSLNTSVWNVWNNQTHGDREWQLYLADEVSVSDGNLVIRTSSRTEMYGKKQYNFTSGWVDTSNKVEFLYGKIEADIKLPKELPGVWPAWWLVQDKGGYCWPVGKLFTLSLFLFRTKVISLFHTFTCLK
jgi:beta-glucanase (GH16 family)